VAAGLAALYAAGQRRGGVVSDFLAEPFDVTVHGGALVVRATPKKLGPMEAEALLDLVFDPDAEAHAQVVIDLTGVEWVNSATMSVLWRVSQSRTLRLVGLGREVEKLLLTMGILHLLDCDPTLDAALRALREDA
jgi:anti-anti-sigma regulatory factor